MVRTQYYKRFQMELALGDAWPPIQLPDGFQWWPWADSLLDCHAQTKALCFRDDLDARIFPSLGLLAGCRDLMHAIRWRPDFCSQATWLVGTRNEAVGTIQGLLDRKRIGAIQNLGVRPEFRGLGLGEALLLRSLIGFRQAGAVRVSLEVTATNTAAIRLYRKYGFRSTRTIYKGVEVLSEEPLPLGL